MMKVKGVTSHMPSRNVVREYVEDEYYHVYNRGVERRLIFLDEQDYTVFLGLLKKYLTGKNTNKHNRHSFNSFNGVVDLIAYCLMPNHFHLLFYQTQADGIPELMRRVITGYVMYFNKRYQRTGRLLQGQYKASHISKDPYLYHVSRYIHLNPEKYKEWPYSSWPYFMGVKKANWVKPGAILELFNDDKKQYEQFIDDYVDTQAELNLLKWQLANGGELD